MKTGFKADNGTHEVDNLTIPDLGEILQRMGLCPYVKLTVQLTRKLLGIIQTNLISMDEREKHQFSQCSTV